MVGGEVMGRCKAGRKRKQGARTKTGRLSRAIVNFDRGTERAQAMQVLYGTDGCDAIGRAYRSGLLGEGNEAKALLDLSRKLSNSYWRAFETGAIRSAIAEKTSGSVIDLDNEKAKRQEAWLTESLRIVDGIGIRRSFDQLVIDVNPDGGPVWLDNLILAKRAEKTADPIDEKRLRDAMDGLFAIGA